MLQSERIQSCSALGAFLQRLLSDTASKELPPHYNDLSLRFQRYLDEGIHYNGWFTRNELEFSMQGWANLLNETNLNNWLSTYDLPVENPKSIGLILAGNIPLVGFHDVLSVLMSGHKAKIRRSSNDQELVALFLEYLVCDQPKWAPQIELVDGKLTDFDAVIATGSSNTARYFDYYFKAKPSIIRRNRNSLAVLSGHETHEQLVALGQDIFRYFGLGCRSVSKLLVPKGYHFEPFFQAMYEYRSVLEYEKYTNNYDYNKAVYLMSRSELLDNGFLILKKETQYASPIATLHYEEYDSMDEVHQIIDRDADLLQCVVSDLPLPRSIPFGSTQHPALTDYADGVDTVGHLVAWGKKS